MAKPPSPHTPMAGRCGAMICAASAAAMDQLTPPMPPVPK
jgi:hypothetical protein